MEVIEADKSTASFSWAVSLHSAPTPGNLEEQDNIIKPLSLRNNSHLSICSLFFHQLWMIFFSLFTPAADVDSPDSSYKHQT